MIARKNLTDLSNGPMPADEVAGNIYNLVNMGYNMALLVDGCRLLQEAPFSSKLAEQGHGSLACVHKFNHDLHTESLAQRAALHQGRHFVEIDPVVKRREALRKSLQKLDAKTGLVTGRHVFFQDLMAELKQQKGALPHAAVNTAMVGHVGLFESLDPRVRQDYETRGRHATARNIAKVKEEK